MFFSTLQCAKYRDTLDGNSEASADAEWNHAFAYSARLFRVYNTNFKEIALSSSLSLDSVQSVGL